MVRRLRLAGEGIREGLADTLGQRRQGTVGGTGHGVLLVNHHGHAGEFRRQAAGAGHIAAHAEHADRLQLAHHAQSLEQRLEQIERRTQQRLQALAAQTADVDQVQRQTGLGHQIVFDAARRAQPVHAVAARLELAGAGQRREDMSACAARHDQDITFHRQSPLR